MLELAGSLFRIDEIQSYNTSNGNVFSKRTFVLRFMDPENREQLVKFTLEPPISLNIIESFNLGQELKVKFFLCGKEKVSKFGEGMSFFEWKRVTSIELLKNENTKDLKKQQPMRIFAEGYVGPDLTQDFSMFPDTIDF